MNDFSGHLSEYYIKCFFDDRISFIMMDYLLRMCVFVALLKFTGNVFVYVFNYYSFSPFVGVDNTYNAAGVRRRQVQNVTTF